MRRFLLSTILLSTLTSPVHAWSWNELFSPSREYTANVVTGVPRIIDGDTVAIRDIRIRLSGIDAPEKRQVCLDAEKTIYRCGMRATEKLAEKIAGDTISCVPERRPDRYQRVLAVCSLRGVDLNRWLIEEGLAVAYGKLYKVEADLAKSKRKGLWDGSFVDPKEWRKKNVAAEVWGKPVSLGDFPALVLQRKS